MLCASLSEQMALVPVSRSDVQTADEAFRK